MLKKGDGLGDFTNATIAIIDHPRPGGANVAITNLRKAGAEVYSEIDASDRSRPTNLGRR